MVPSNSFRVDSFDVAPQQHLLEYVFYLHWQPEILTSLVGFHVFTGAKILNTLSDSSQCTVVFQAISAIIGIIVSLPRTLNHVSTMSVVSAICMAIAIILSLVYAGIEPNPLYGYGG